MSKKYVFPSVANAGLCLILGLGETGIAAANWCTANGGHIRLLDTRAQLADKAEIQKLSVDRHFGSDVLSDFAFLDGVQTLVISPGLNPNDVAVAKFLDAARSKNINIISEIELFAMALADLAKQDYKPMLLTVTGTNGKTTVSSLLGHLLQDSGVSTRVAGNISPAALTSLLQALQEESLPQAWVLELSSFQLHTTKGLMADAAVVLNISQDHLDWHGSMGNYINDKAHIYKMAKLAVVNRADENVMRMVADIAAPNVRSFGSDMPVYAGDFGLELQSGIDWLAAATMDDKAELQRSQTKAQKLMPVGALQIIGQHNVQNVLAALTMLNALDIPLANMLHSVRTYRGVTHRTEFIRTIAGVDFIDDGKGTNVSASVAALNGIEKPVVLIAGGLGKGQDFTDLATAIKNNAKAVCLIGQAANEIAEALQQSELPIVFCESMVQAVSQAFAMASAGDVVLLSPACASMDMFKNYIHRSECFVQAVQEIALDHGEFA